MTVDPRFRTRACEILVGAVLLLGACVDDANLSKCDRLKDTATDGATVECVDGSRPEGIACTAPPPACATQLQRTEMALAATVRDETACGAWLDFLCGETATPP